MPLRGCVQTARSCWRPWGQNGSALQYAAWELRDDLLAENKIAFQGSAAPICTITMAKIVGTGIAFQAAVGMGRGTVDGELPLAATLGDLAGEFSSTAGARFVHLLVPGSDRPVSPLDVMLPLKAFASE